MEAARRSETAADSATIQAVDSQIQHQPAPGGGTVRQAQNRSELMILIPAFNEVGAIASVIEEVQKVAPGTPILVVDDASIDGTYERAKCSGAHVLRLPYHLGLGGCVQAGYKLAYELGYDYVI